MNEVQNGCTRSRICNSYAYSGISNIYIQDLKKRLCVNIFHIQERESNIKKRYINIDLNLKYIPIDQPNYLISACNSWVGRTEEAAKGQWISKADMKFIWTKKPTMIFSYFCPSLKNKSVKKNNFSLSRTLVIKLCIIWYNNLHFFWFDPI